ncbi:Organic solvent tolerance protein OstA-like protein [Candidatus Koribacter versatilis Ellin345]|uniref:Organic solvent tolerance protein OstA-like protein n=1 Tax=Koribacter versatilis (strain Ellin345) TaxID=204669 RepID=Q1IVD5_KORVE|nr:LPS assembly protein LptD [Candidatus Koribacter versatilis]ABF39165.1 Organic solvent tolerance protein OstA-like protein [Candidatus Koribacter versatilis Ellin345]
MTFRRETNTTLRMGCHLLLLCCLLTSGLLAQKNLKSEKTSPAIKSSQSSRPPEDVLIEAREQEKIGSIYKLRGNVVIRFRGFVLHSDEITYDDSTGEVQATGHLVLEGGPHDEHLTATHGTLNVQTQTGKFYDVTGMTGAKFRGKNVILTSSNPFVFTGEVVEKVAPDRYVVYHGVITTCELPQPKWTFHAAKIDVVVGADAKIYHSDFRLHGIPVFYFPYVQHPVENLGRQTGFLLPNIGQSSQKGTILGDSFYWAINTSSDLSVGAEYFSQRGWAEHGEFRSRPDEKTTIDLHYFQVLDRKNQGGAEVRLSAETKAKYDIRAVADIDYLTSFIFREAFAESYTQAINSEVKSVAFLTKSIDTLSFNAMASRYQNFLGTNQCSTLGIYVPCSVTGTPLVTTGGDSAILIVHAPTFELTNVEKQIARTRFFFWLEGAAEGLKRSEPDLATLKTTVINYSVPYMGRYDIQPALSYALFLNGWTLRPSIAMRDTYYTQRALGNVSIEDPVNRRSLEAGFEFRPPALEKIFEKPIFQHQVKHTIEPRIIYNYVNGVDNFHNIIRFDARDILSNTNEVLYAFTTRVYTKNLRATSDCPDPLTPENKLPHEQLESLKPKSTCGDLASRTREAFSWDLAQKYYFDPTFGGAVINGTRNVFTTSAELTGIAYIDSPRRFSPFVSRMRIQTTANTDVQWNFDYDSVAGRINASTVIGNYRFSEYFVGASHAFLNTTVPDATSSNVALVPARFNQIRFLGGFGHPNKTGFGAAASLGFDATQGFLQYSAAQLNYNWDCCGVSAEYRRFALGNIRNENQFRFSLTLANVGSFGTMKRQERLY